MPGSGNSNSVSKEKNNQRLGRPAGKWTLILSGVLFLFSAAFFCSRDPARGQIAAGELSGSGIELRVISTRMVC